MPHDACSEPSSSKALKSALRSPRSHDPRLIVALASLNDEQGLRALRIAPQQALQLRSQSPVNRSRAQAEHDLEPFASSVNAHSGMPGILHHLIQISDNTKQLPTSHTIVTRHNTDDHCGVGLQARTHMQANAHALMLNWTTHAHTCTQLLLRLYRRPRS
jgi:hypothetical protein